MWYASFSVRYGQVELNIKIMSNKNDQNFIAFFNELRAYVDYEKDMPSGNLRTEDDVIRYIKTMDYAEECAKTRIMIKERLIHLGGSATKMCLDKLFEK